MNRKTLLWEINLKRKSLFLITDVTLFKRCILLCDNNHFVWFGPHAKWGILIQNLIIVGESALTSLPKSPESPLPSPSSHPPSSALPLLPLLPLPFPLLPPPPSLPCYKAGNLVSRFKQWHLPVSIWTSCLYWYYIYLLYCPVKKKKKNTIPYNISCL